MSRERIKCVVPPPPCILARRKKLKKEKGGAADRLCLCPSPPTTNIGGVATMPFSDTTVTTRFVHERTVTTKNMVQTIVRTPVVRKVFSWLFYDMEDIGRERGGGGGGGGTAVVYNEADSEETKKPFHPLLPFVAETLDAGCTALHVAPPTRDFVQRVVRHNTTVGVKRITFSALVNEDGCDAARISRVAPHLVDKLVFGEEEAMRNTR